MVLSGEGSDEIFGGYLYFHAAPTPEIFHQECVKRVKSLHVSDCLRANKCECPVGRCAKAARRLTHDKRST